MRSKITLLAVIFFYPDVWRAGRILPPGTTTATLPDQTQAQTEPVH